MEQKAWHSILSLIRSIMRILRSSFLILKAYWDIAICSDMLLLKFGVIIPSIVSCWISMIMAQEKTFLIISRKTQPKNKKISSVEIMFLVCGLMDIFPISNISCSSILSPIEVSMIFLNILSSLGLFLISIVKVIIPTNNEVLHW